jgi:hypothetical protein
MQVDVVVDVVDVVAAVLKVTLLKCLAAVWQNLFSLGGIILQTMILSHLLLVYL